MLNRLLFFFRNVSLVNSNISIAWNTKITADKSAQVNIKNGFLKFGFDTDANCAYPTKNGSLIKLGNSAKLTIHGNVSISKGASLIIGDNAEVEFMGDNIIAHDTFIYANKKIYFGKNACASWNCTFMDWDGHVFLKENKKIDPSSFYRPLQIGNGVGIQMNVTIPRGVSIGDKSIISANTTLRQNVDQNTMVYSTNMIEIKPGYQSGLL